MEDIFKAYYNSPVGLVEISGGENSITSVNFVEEGFEAGFETNDYVQNCALQLSEYFNGRRREFDLKLEPDGTEFQKKVWAELLKIPFGVTKSYMQITRTLGNEKTIRAVANANGQNKIAIIIPCHRVIGSNGDLTGYAGGLWRKKWLLEHESNLTNGEKQMELF